MVFVFVSAEDTSLVAPSSYDDDVHTDCVEDQLRKAEVEMINAKNIQLRWARLAGFLYLFTYVVPMTGWAICGRYEVPGNFAETAHRVMGSELFYRFGLSCLLFNWILCILMAMGLYAVLKPVDSTIALFGLLFRLIENVLAIAFSLLDFVAVKAYASGDISAAFTAKQLSAMFALLAHADAIQFNVSMVFLGIGSAFFFYLFFKSGYIPRILSIYSLCACPIFIAVSWAFLYWPQLSGKFQLGWYPMAFAEISVGLWLLIKGIKIPSAALSDEQVS